MGGKNLKESEVSLLVQHVEVNSDPLVTYYSCLHYQMLPKVIFMMPGKNINLLNSPE